MIFINGRPGRLSMEWLLFVGVVKKHCHNVNFGNGK
jgi:hypothetical protein